MLILLLGAPGAGKATQCAKLKEFYKFETLATGEILRKEVRDNTPIGQKIKGIMNKGHLVEDQILIDLVTSELEANRPMLLDGFPRTLYQADMLSEYLTHHGKRIDAVIYLEVDKEKAIERVSGRRICPDCGTLFHIKHFPPKSDGICDACGAPLYKRLDDQIDNLLTKLNEYEMKTRPLIDYYEDLGLLKRINGNESVMDVFYQLIQSSVKFTEMSE
jgi:adenylate kinase